MWSLFKVLFWGNLWLVLWVLLLPFQRNRENCLTWALKQWEMYGGYVVIRWCRQNKSSWIVWPHFLWLPEQSDHNLVHVIPPDDEWDENSQRMLPKAWFTPRKIHGDPYDVNEN